MTPKSQPPSYPLQLACPKCRVAVWFTKERPVPFGDIATCPSCGSPCVTPEECNRQILEEHQRRQKA